MYIGHPTTEHEVEWLAVDRRDPAYKYLAAHDFSALHNIFWLGRHNRGGQRSRFALSDGVTK
jgi:hypothetical protein